MFISFCSILIQPLTAYTCMSVSVQYWYNHSPHTRVCQFLFNTDTTTHRIHVYVSFCSILIQPLTAYTCMSVSVQYWYNHLPHTRVCQFLFNTDTTAYRIHVSFCFILIMLIMVAARNDSNTGIRPHTTSLPHLLCTNSNSCIRMGRCLGGRYLIPPQLKYKFWVQVCGLWLIKVVIKERQNRTNTQKDVSNCKKWTFIDITLHSLKMLGLYLYTIILGHIYYIATKNAKSGDK